MPFSALAFSINLRSFYIVKIGHFSGAVLLIAGTTIGAGMLALPVMTAFAGFFPSFLMFVITWVVMLASSYFFLDVNLVTKGEPNLISMIHKTLGPWGKVIGWIVYLLLLYSLTAAYISASASLLFSALSEISPFPIPSWIGPFILPLVFGFFIYMGTLGVDMVNRFLMIGKGLAIFLLICFLPPHIEKNFLLRSDFKPLVMTIPVIVTSFGYHIIIPTLTTYMHHDKKKLRLALLTGSLIALVLYLLWEVMILGTLPLEGKDGLIKAWKEGASATAPLTHMFANRWITLGAHFFPFFAIVTSFLGVTLSLSDFLTDGFKLKKSFEGKLLAMCLTFVPPLIFVFSYQRGFIIALEYAGAFVAILLIFLPALMAWKIKTPKFYSTFLGRICLLLVMLFGLAVVVIDVLEQFGVFKPLLSKYHV